MGSKAGPWTHTCDLCNADLKSPDPKPRPESGWLSFSVDWVCPDDRVFHDVTVCPSCVKLIVSKAKVGRDAV